MDTSGIADDEGMENAVFTSRWMAGGTDILNATGASYTLAEDDEGLTIQVWVTFTDDVGNEEGVSAAPSQRGTPGSRSRRRRSWWATHTSGGPRRGRKQGR